MTKKQTDAVVAATQKLYKGDATARRFFDALA
jgi:hypothetical protein